MFRLLLLYLKMRFFKRLNDLKITSGVLIFIIYATVLRLNWHKANEWTDDG